MTVHSKMFDAKEKKEPTMHRVYVEFEGGYFVSLGVIDASFQQMVESHGRPTKVEFRATDEGWYEDDMGDNGDEGGTGDHR
jgi:hypothetical protein